VGSSLVNLDEVEYCIKSMPRLKVVVLNGCSFLASTLLEQCPEVMFVSWNDTGRVLPEEILAQWHEADFAIVSAWLQVVHSCAGEPCHDIVQSAEILILCPAWIDCLAQTIERRAESEACEWIITMGGSFTFASQCLQSVGHGTYGLDICHSLLPSSFNLKSSGYFA
jgi:hypothetical protein